MDMKLRIARELMRLAADIIEMGPRTSFHGSFDNLTNFSQITEDNIAEIGRMLLAYLYKHAPDYGLNRQDAQDAMQKINMWMLRKLREGFFNMKQNKREGEPLRGYFLRIADRALKYIYGRKVNQHEVLQDVGDYIDKNEDDRRREHELENDVKEALAMLYRKNPDYALILYYMYIWDYKPQEIHKTYYPDWPPHRVTNYASFARRYVVDILRKEGISYNTSKHYDVSNLRPSEYSFDNYMKKGRKASADEEDEWIGELLSDPKVWDWLTPPEQPEK